MSDKPIILTPIPGNQNHQCKGVGLIYINMENKVYTLEVSADNSEWRTITEFVEGQESRYGEPFNAEIAIKEAKSYKHAMYGKMIRGTKINYVRIIVEI